LAVVTQRSSKDSLSIAKFLTDRVKAFEGTSSQHRLNQRPQNSQLQSATQVKEKISQLKKQTKTEGFDVNVQLWIYPENRGGAAKKVWPNCDNAFVSLLIAWYCRLKFHRFLLILKVDPVPITCWMSFSSRSRKHTAVAQHTKGCNLLTFLNGK
jgi:hypothetical protein